MAHEERVYVENIVGLASYDGEKIYLRSRRLKKSGMRYRRTRTMSRWQQQQNQRPRTEFALSSKQMSVPGRVAHPSTRLLLIKKREIRSIVIRDLQERRIIIITKLTRRIMEIRSLRGIRIQEIIILKGKMECH